MFSRIDDSDNNEEVVPAHAAYRRHPSINLDLVQH